MTMTDNYFQKKVLSLYGDSVVGYLNIVGSFYAVPAITDLYFSLDITTVNDKNFLHQLA